jgi:hypothetical protein
MGQVEDWVRGEYVYDVNLEFELKGECEKE